ncbi:MAG: class I SAM-dependent methyltransferase [Clostridiales bacterium]|nr:class I SAM-dependent methyltransferase [Clostridiales bacterium]
MQDVNYSEWADYIEGIFKRFQVSPSLVADLGCGTGSFCVEMARRGYDMIGIDLSEDMLSIAQTKARDNEKDILFLNQGISEFELYGTVDAMVCLMDSINYVTYKKDVKKAFKLVENYLNPGGLFVFDINSKYKFENILGNNVFYQVNEDISYIWQNEYDRKSRICSFDLTFFTKTGELYSRFDEVHYERAYDVQEMVAMIRESGLEPCGIFGAFGFTKPKAECERVFFVCRKTRGLQTCKM